MNTSEQICHWPRPGGGADRVTNSVLNKQRTSSEYADSCKRVNAVRPIFGKALALPDADYGKPVYWIVFTRAFKQAGRIDSTYGNHIGKQEMVRLYLQAQPFAMLPVAGKLMIDGNEATQQTLKPLPSQTQRSPCNEF